jgi:hypothetical protein
VRVQHRHLGFNVSRLAIRGASIGKQLTPYVQYLSNATLLDCQPHHELLNEKIIFSSYSKQTKEMADIEVNYQSVSYHEVHN